MRLSPDDMIFWRYGFLKLNGTIVFTWALMIVLAIGAKLITRNLSTELKRTRWQNLLEMIVTSIEKQIEEVGLPQPEKYIGFLGTLFLFVALAALCTVIPGYEPPTSSLSTTRHPRRSATRWATCDPPAPYWREMVISIGGW